MPLVKATLKQTLFSKLKDIFEEQSAKGTSGDEQQDPKEVIRDISDKMATAIADAVDAYIKSGDIIVGPSNVVVTSTAPGTPAVVAPASPAKMI